MAIVEVSCPRCGSLCHTRGELKNEYHCDHCGATFRLIDTTKKEIIHDTRPHNCPICGRPVKAEEGYVCTECGKEFLCDNCVDEITDSETHLEKSVCKLCLKKKGLSCEWCSNPYAFRCTVCGKQYCEEHADFDMHIRVKKGKWGMHFSLWCDNCKGNVCRRCYVEKTSVFGGKAYYCKKCGTKLKVDQPLTERSRQFNENVETLMLT